MRYTLIGHTVQMLLISLVGLLLIAHPAGGQQPKETKQILLLVSGSATMPGYEMAIEGVQATFSRNDEFGFQYFIEYMDNLRFNDERYHKLLIDSYELKYSDKKIDMIIAIGPSATAFWSSYGEDILGHVPMVSCWGLKEQLESKNHDQIITGSILEIDYQGLLDVAVKNHPETRDISVVIDNSQEGQWVEKQIRTSYAPYVEKYNISYLSGLKMSDLLERLAALPEESIIVYYFVAIDGWGHHYDPFTVASMIAEVATVPTYGFSETYVGRGIVGGRVVSFTEHGKRAGEIGLRILKGENPANIPSSSEGTNLTMFDWRQLKRWDIDEDTLPEGSDIFFKDVPLWKSHQWFIIGGTITLTILGAFVVGLSIQRKRLQDMVRRVSDSEMRYRMFVDYSSEGIWCAEFDEPIDLSLPEEEQFKLVLKHGYMAEANDAYAQHVGCEHRKELVGRRLRDFLPLTEPTNIATIKAWIHNKYTIKDVETIESYKDDVTRIILNNSFGIIESGHVKRVWGTETDITKRKQAEKALLHSRNFNKAILNTIQDHIAVTDESGCILTVNDSWMKFASDNDVDLSQIGPGVNYLDVCRRAVCRQQNLETEQKIIEQSLEGLTDVLNGDASQFILEYHCHSPIEKRCFQMVVLPLLGEKGGLVVAHRNITDLKETEKKVLDAEQKYRTVADFTYDWEYWEAPDNSLIYVSPSCERITDYSVSDFMGRPELLSEIIVPEDKEIWDGHNHGEHTDSADVSCRFRIKRKDGEIRWIAHVCQPVYSSEGDFDGVRSSNRDITELQKAESIASDHLAMLANLDRRATLGQLTGSIAHELNQPLTGILADAQAGEMLLNKEMIDKTQIQEIFSDIISDTKRASRVIQNLRDLFKGKMADLNPVNMNVLIKETLQLLNSELLSENVIVQTNLALDLPDIVGNRIQLQQVLINLFKNACDSMNFSEKDDRRMYIYTTWIDEHLIELSVGDNGPGIDPDSLDSLFEPLFQVNEGGMGMGLSICKSIVQAHGGSVLAKNDPNGGAIFQVSLPIHR